MIHDDNDSTDPGADTFPALSTTILVAPADEVVAELRKSAVPRLGRTLLAALAAGELGRWRYPFSPFVCLYGFKAWTGSLEAFPQWGGVEIKLPDGTRSSTHACGAWQDQPGTYRDAVRVTGRAAFYPQDQIANNWVIASRDFAVHGGGDLLPELQAAGRATAALEVIASKLRPTWPGGADTGLPARYIAALELFVDTPAPPPPIDPATTPIIVRPGVTICFPIIGTDQDGRPYTPDDALVSDDPSIVAVDVSDGIAEATGGATLGRVLVHGADLVIVFVNEPRRLVHLVADLSKAVRNTAAGAAAVALALLPMGMPVIAPPAPLVYFAPADRFNSPAEMVITIIPELPALTSPVLVPCLVGVGRSGVRVGSAEECGGRWHE